jgi:tetratricopeptide (TPR) repeat protein
MYTRLDRAAESLRLFGKMRSRFVEVESLLRGAFEALGPRRGADPHPTWALIGSWHQLFLVELRQPHQAAERMAAWLELFERSGDADKAAHASLALAQALMREGIFPESLEHLERSLHLFEELKDPFWRAQALHSLGYYQAATGNWTAFETSIRQSLDLYRQIGAVLGQSEALENLASAIYAAGEYQRGEEYLLEAHELRRRLRNAHGVAYTGAGLAEMAFFRGDFEAARQRVGEAVSLALEVSDPESMGYARVILGYLACADGRFQEGLDLYAEALHVDPNSPFIKMSCAWGRALAHLGLEDWESLRAGLLASVDPAMELGGPAHLLAWLPFAAVLNAREGRLEEALALAALVRRQPAAIAGWIRLFRPLARRLKHMEKEAPAGSMDGAQRKAGELKPAAALQSYLERHQRPEHER